MIIKAETPDGSYILYDNVKAVKACNPEVFYPSIPNGIVNRSELEDFIEDVLARSIMGNFAEPVDRKCFACEESPYDQEATESCITPPQSKSIMLGCDNEINSLRGRKILFNGRTMVDVIVHGNKSEELYYLFKHVSFIKDDYEYWVYTTYPVYICSDEGKTLEIVK